MDAPLFDMEGRAHFHPASWISVYSMFTSRAVSAARSACDYKLDFYAHLSPCVTGCMPEGENVIITGDFNTAHMPIDLKNPNKMSGHPVSCRKSVPGCRSFLDHGFVDVYRHLYPDRVQYTWWTYRL